MLGIIAIILLVLFALGMPIAIAMGLSGFAALLIRGDIPLETAAQRFVTGVDSFPLLAVPFLSGWYGWRWRWSGASPAGSVMSSWSPT